MSYGEFLRRVTTVFAMAVGLLGLWYLRDIILLAFLSVIITLVLSAPVERMEAAGLHRRGAIAITVVGVFVVLVLFFIWVGPLLFNALNGLTDDLPDAYQDAVDYYDTWRLDQPQAAQQLLPELDAERNIDSDIENNLVSSEQVAEFLLPGLSRIGSVVATVFANVAVILVVSLFFLFDPNSHIRGFLALIPAEYHERAAHVLFILRQTLRNWLTTLSFSMLVTALLVEIYLGLILQIPNSLALALLAAIMTVIPNIGAAVPLIPITIFTLADDPALLPFAIGGYLAIQQIESNALTPLFIKSRMQIPPALLFLFQIAATALFGLLGLILAVPMLSAIIAVVRELYVYDLLGFRDKYIKLTIEDSELVVELEDAPKSLPKEKPKPASDSIEVPTA